MPQIVRYQIQYHPGANKGRIGVHLDDGGELTLPIESTQELTLIALLLQHGAVRIDPDGTLDTGGRDVGT